MPNSSFMMAIMIFFIMMIIVKVAKTNMSHKYDFCVYLPISKELMPIALVGSPIVMRTSLSSMK